MGSDLLHLLMGLQQTHYKLKILSKITDSTAVQHHKRAYCNEVSAWKQISYGGCGEGFTSEGETSNCFA